MKDRLFGLSFFLSQENLSSPFSVLIYVEK